MPIFKTAPPLSMQIASALKEKIKNNEIKPGERLQSVRKLASELSVGRQVIVSAFDMLAKENILKKRRGCGVFINPELNEAPKTLRIGFWINAVNVFSASNSGALFNICRKASESGHNIILGTSLDNEDFKNWAETNNIEGVIVTGLIDNAFVEIAESLEIPFVVLGNYELGHQVNIVNMDISVLETAVINEIDKHSCRKVGAIVGKKSYLISKQLAGHVKNALESKKLPVYKELFCFSDTEEGYKEIKQMLEKTKNKPDLIYATEQAFPGIARYYFEKNLSRKNAPRLIISCGQKEKIPYPELVDITLECGTGGSEKSFDMLLDIIKEQGKNKPVLYKSHAKIIYGKDY